MVSTEPEPEVTTRSSLVPLALAIGFAVAAGVAVRWGLGDRLEPREALELLRSVQDRWWAAPGYVTAYLLGTSVLLPAVLFHMVAGAAWGFTQATVLNFVAVNAVANLQFAVGRRLGRRRTAGLIARYRLQRFDEFVATNGFRAMVLIRLLPLPFVGVNVAAGVSAMPWSQFALGSMTGSLPVMLVYTYFAASLVEGVAGAQRQAMIQAALAGLAIVVLTFAPWAVRWIRHRRGRGPGGDAQERSSAS